MKTNAQRIEAFPENRFSGEFPDIGNVGWCRFSKAAPQMLYRHSHDDAFEVCLLRRGAAIWQVGGNLFNVQPGELFITWPGEPHGGEGNMMHPCELYWIIFRLSPGSGSFGLTPAETAALHKALLALRCRKFKAPQNMTGYFDRMLTALRSRDPFKQTKVNATMQLLLCDLLSAETAARKSPQTATGTLRFRDLIRKLNETCSEPLTVETLAAKAGLKTSRFRVLFCQETGFSPVEYLTRLRIQKAKTMLLQGDAPVTDIAFDLGFSSSQYFARTFRKLTGLSPRNFRNLCRR
jgi:AraC-like DNA-binding protein